MPGLCHIGIRRVGLGDPHIRVHHAYERRCSKAGVSRDQCLHRSTPRGPYFIYNHYNTEAPKDHLHNLKMQMPRRNSHSTPNYGRIKGAIVVILGLLFPLVSFWFIMAQTHTVQTKIRNLFGVTPLSTRLILCESTLLLGRRRQTCYPSP